MGLRFIRQPSETPNISNADDALMIRYAYGNQNGYVKGRGAELSYTIDGTKFRINSGVVVLQGYETEIDANGWELNIGVIPTTQYYSIYYEVNLATQTTSIKSVYGTTGYPVVSAGDDLTTNRTGTARLILYQLRAQNGVFQSVTKVVKPVRYFIDYISDLENGDITVKNATNADSLTQTLPISKGGTGSTSLTGNRLVMVNSSGSALTTVSSTGIIKGDGTAITASSSQVVLGDGSGRSITTSVTSGSNSLVTSGAVYTAIQNFYGSGSLSVSSLSASTNEIKRQGNLVYARFIASVTANLSGVNITIPQYCSVGNTSLKLRPSTTKTNGGIYYYRVTTTTPPYYTIYADFFDIPTNGQITLSWGVVRTVQGFQLLIAYEL